MEWQRAADPGSGKAYYFCSNAQASQWEFPESVLVDTLARHGYAKATTEDGLMYFYREDTGESVWDLPNAVLSELQGIFGTDLTEEEIKNAGGGGGETVETAAVETNSNPSVETGVEKSTKESKAKALEEMEIDTNFETSPGSSNSINQLLGIGSVKNKDKSKDDENNDSKNKVKPEEAFMQMLQSHVTDSNSTFVQMIPTLINDDRYWLLKDAIERQRLFHEHIDAMKIAEIQASKEKHKSGFMKLFEKHKVKSYTRWATFVNLITGDDQKLFQSVPDIVVRDFFDEYVANLKAKKEKALQEERQKELKELDIELQEIIAIDTQFLKVLPNLQNKYKNLSKLDILEAFEKRVVEVENMFQSVIEENRKLNDGVDRNARLQFQEMLKNEISEGRLQMTSRTRWFQFVQAIKDKPEFIELCGHQGSSSIDYYWDLLDECNCRLIGKVDLFRQQLINSNKKITQLSIQEFITIIKRSNRKELSEMNEEDITSVYDMMRAESPFASGTKRPAEEMRPERSQAKRSRITLRRPN